MQTFNYTVIIVSTDLLEQTCSQLANLMMPDIKMGRPNVRQCSTAIGKHSFCKIIRVWDGTAELRGRVASNPGS